MRGKVKAGVVIKTVERKAAPGGSGETTFKAKVSVKSLSSSPRKGGQSTKKSSPTSILKQQTAHYPPPPPGGSGGGTTFLPDDDVTTSLMTRMVEDAQTLDEIRRQAAVAVQDEAGARVLHGMIEVSDDERGSKRVV